MAKAEKLPSGNWRCRAYDRKTKTRKSFTAATRSEAEYLAREWLTGRRPRPTADLTVGECIEEYIRIKDNILSPTTISKYKNILRNQLSKQVLSCKLHDLDNIILQDEINRLSAIYAPKTVHNASGLMSAAIKVFYPQYIYIVTLPKKQKRIRELPTAEQILPLFSGTDMELIVLLGMWQGFRASEIRGLKKSDFKDGKLTINRVIVTVDGKQIEKDETKTANSRRQLSVPPIIQQLVDEIDGEYITKRTGVSIYKSFKRRVARAGFPDMTFHDLRHLNASVMLMLGVPDKYAMERGGWSTTATLKSVYQETFSDKRREVDKKIDTFFEDVYKKTGHKTAHETQPQYKTKRKYKLIRSS